ncbi:MAG: GtrA family protein, partial [Sphaerochaetaceae bacterium]|nr:GtrA family protein [Sphaerochaetaceae bacterium]
WFSSAANYVTGGIASFFLNKYFTFQNKEHSVQQVLKFILTVAVCYLVAYGISKPFVLRILSGSNLRKQENIAMFFGMGIYTVLNYLGQRFFAFYSKK